MAALLVASGSGAALAQASADTVRLSPVVVTASRIPTPRDAEPASVTVLDGRELETLGVRSLAEALRDVAGVDLARNGSFGGATSLFVRGGESDYVKVLIDGVPLNDPGGAIDLADLGIDAVERIEIVRGPASVLYGSDAVTGVVQVFTRRGEGPARVDLGLRAGSYASVDATGGVRGRTGPFGYAMTVSHARTDGIYDLNNVFTNSIWTGRVSARPDSRTDVTLGARYGGSRYHFPTESSGQANDMNAFQDRDRLTATLEIGHRFTPTLEGRVSVAWSRSADGIDDRPDDPADTLGFYAFANDRTVRRRSTDLRLTAVPTPWTTVTAGASVEWQDERSASESWSEFGASSSAFDANRVSGGVYAQVQMMPVRGIALVLGSRIDRSDVFGTFLSYRGGVSYRLAGGTRARATLGRAFKEPTFFEQFADDPFARGNPALRPERSLSWEVGLEQEALGGAVLVGATYFDQRFLDLVQYVFAPDPAEPSYVNVAAATARGLELEAELDLPGAGTLRGSYTYLLTQVTDAGVESGSGGAFVDGARLLRRPTHSARLTMIERLSPRATFSGTLRFVGDRDDRDFASFPAETVTMGAYATIDLSAEAEVWRSTGSERRLAVTGAVRDLFDRHPAEVFGFLSPGRTVMVGVRAGW